MKAVVQRVSSASVRVEECEVARIDRGFLVLVGVRRGDGERDAAWLAHKVAGLRVFGDEKGKMNRALTHPEVIERLKGLFDDDLVVFSPAPVKGDRRVGIHTRTSRFIHRTLVAFDIEYLLCFGDKILKKELVDAFSRRLINFHPSILPAFPGLNAIDQALIHGVDLIGNTAHFIDEGIDTGSIILQSAMPTEEYEEYEDVLELQLPMIKMILRDILGFPVPDTEIFSDISGRDKAFLIPKRCRG